MTMTSLMAFNLDCDRIVFFQLSRFVDVCVMDLVNIILFSRNSEILSSLFLTCPNALTSGQVEVSLIHSIFTIN